MTAQQIVSKADHMAAQLAKEVQPMSHKEMTRHMRDRIKAAGIKARVRMNEYCGVLWIQVFGVSYEAQFSEDEQRAIKQIAITNGLTRVQGMPIDLERMTDGKGFEFVFHGSRY